MYIIKINIYIYIDVELLGDFLCCYCAATKWN